MAPGKQTAGESEFAEAPIYQIRIDLMYIRPPIWRRVLIPSDFTLDMVHDVIQVAMDWTSSHLHMFDDGDDQYGDVSFEELEFLDEELFYISDVMSQVGDILIYEYDFGDGWRHCLKLEKILPPDPGVRYPVCTAGRRACPPEDVGGVPGYEEFLEALQDEAHPEHEMYVEWIGGDFDPEDFDAEEVTRELQGLFAGFDTEGFEPHPLTTVRWQLLSPELAQVIPPGMPEYLLDPGPGHNRRARRIRTARTATALLDLLPVENPMLIVSWGKRFDDFVPDIIPLAAKRLKEPDRWDPDDWSWVQERLVCVIGRYGQRAVEALRAVFDDLDAYGKALACVALGQLGAHRAADRIWRYFETALETAETGYILGPLWGLIDLEDPRASDAVAIVFEEGWIYGELPAMAGRAGDRRALLPLLAWMAEDQAAVDSDIGAAITLVAHRIGRQAIIEELDAVGVGQDPVRPDITPESVADQLLSPPAELAEARFADLYRTMTLEEFLSAADEAELDFDAMPMDPDDWYEELEADEPVDAGAGTVSAPPPAGERPELTDVCWCGSGKTYRYCHWHADQRNDIPQAA